MIQGLIILNVPGYRPHAFHATLLTIAVIVFSIVFNTVLATRLPMIEYGILVLHFAGFAAVVVTLWATAPLSNAHALFEFNNEGAWQTTGLAAIIGMTSSSSTLTGYDCSVHMCKEMPPK